MSDLNADPYRLQRAAERKRAQTERLVAVEIRAAELATSGPPRGVKRRNGSLGLYSRGEISGWVMHHWLANWHRAPRSQGQLAGWLAHEILTGAS